LDSTLYSSIINEHLYPFVTNSFNGQCVLHQDNDPKHSSKLCINAFKDAKITWEKSPPQSPDLNPIEMLWADMKKFIRKQRCRNINDVQNAIAVFHRALTPEKCTKYIDRLHKVNLIGN
jgi:transposase